jgi:hypothetical protein
MRIEDWMFIGRNREIPTPLDPPEGKMIDLGAGKRPVGGAIAFDRPEWNAGERMDWLADESVGTIWMNGFVDYLNDDTLAMTLWECCRVLRPDGIINVVVPHGMSELSASDPSKLTRWNEKSWRNFLENPHWEAFGTGIPLRVHTQFILGIVWRNLSLFTQLVKTP